MDPKPSLTLWEYAMLPFAISQIILVIAVARIKAPFRKRGDDIILGRYVLYDGMRTVVEKMSLRQFQAINPSTTEAYEAFAKGQGLKPDIATLPDGSLGCWIGDKNADTTLVWLHGGGFAFMASKAHVEFLFQLVSRASRHGLKMAIFLLQYDVAPRAQYPRQIEQTVTAIRYLTDDIGKPYQELLIGGDSAGGTLAIALPSHLSHPHPAIPALNNNGVNLRGVILLSPWVSLDFNFQSFETNRHRDNLSDTGLNIWAKALAKHNERDNYNSPLDASADWWQNVQAERVLILAGESEVLVDEIRQFAEKLKRHNKQRIDTLVSPGECHNPPVSERQLGIHRENGMIEEKIYQWLLSKAVSATSGRSASVS
ncbi:Alpha/Beta hydrolase protein [Hypoxylon trugodes]|uniref:Alpha/Beta hydrolase protein n=1 Tax=Hypoxylon trugodes TaxID=326681 RepID=UPI002192D268|nr:Alpha/Beta hydrolase protein [Hypoxylon trugodes]KAI1393092.1 Alpha/Beta hydrolase protein [Hypoxylon trugodes]